MDENGNPLPVGWVQMKARAQGGRPGERAFGGMYEFRGAAEPIPGQKPDRPDADFISAWKIAGENEPMSFTWRWQRPDGGEGTITI
jgi:hypothetical protein